MPLDFTASIKKTALLLLTVVVLQACNYITFDAPHPSNQTQVFSFESSRQGIYYFADSTFKVEDEAAVKNGYYVRDFKQINDSLEAMEAHLHITESAVTYSFSATNIWNLDILSPCYAYYQLHTGKGETKIEGKYLVQKGGNSDTLLNLKAGDLMYSYNGKLYLNRKREDHNKKKPVYWEIAQLQFLDNGGCTLSITNEQDYKLLFDSTENMKEIFPYAKISNKTFLDFVKNGGFRKHYNFAKKN